MIKKYQIVGLDCANCARELEEQLQKIKGMEDAKVDFMGGKVYFTGSEQAILQGKELCNHFEDAKIVEEGEPHEHAHVHHDHHEHCNCGHDHHEHSHDHCNCGHEHHEHSHDHCNCGHNHKEHHHEQPQTAFEGKKVKIKDLDCANCARELEEELNALQGVQARVDFMNMTVILKTENQEDYKKAIATIEGFEDVKVIDEAKPQKTSVIKEHLWDILRISIAALLFIPIFICSELKVLEIGNWIFLLFAPSYLLVGYDILIKTAKNLSKGRIFDENFLMIVASLGAIILGALTGDGLAEGVAVMILYQLGELLQGIAVGASRKSIAGLMQLKAETATLLKDGKQQIVAPEDLKEGDTILVKVGEKIPVDSVVLQGQSTLDMKSLNGEALPKEVKEGDEVLSGAINVSQVLTLKVVRAYQNSAVAKILELVENSTATRAASEKFISKFAKYYTPIVCLLAVLIAAIVPTIMGAVQGEFLWQTYAQWIYRSLSFLVISCPCALVISVPLTYFGGIGRSARSGILVKGSTCLDALAVAKTIAFDKTGTLTEGKFVVQSISNEQALQFAVAAEQYSVHPIAQAFQGMSTPYTATEVKELAGKGILAKIEEKSLLCGNAKWLQEEGIVFQPEESLSTLLYVAWGGQYIGVIRVDDQIKQNAKQVVIQLKSLAIQKTAMLTGDSIQRAEAVSKQIGLDEVYGGLLPDQKLSTAQAIKEGGLIYVGDGINDAPVMTIADCAISMGKTGSDAAIEASDIVLVDDHLERLPLARKIARKTRSIVWQNIVGSLVVKFLIMAFAVALPTFPLIVAIFGDVGVMLIAVLNAMRTQLIR